MSLFEQVMALAVQMPQTERERLAQALGVKAASPTGGQTLPLQQFVARPDPVAWRKAETGHAVLNTAASGQGVVEFPEGPGAIAGMWAHRAGDSGEPAETGQIQGDWPVVASMRQGTPVVMHTDVCVELALGREKAVRFFEKPPVEVRLATATYLTLLSAAENETQLQRIRRFVQPYAVLSLGPMASSRAVELILAHTLEDGLGPLEALIAATALAHEIPIVAHNPQPFGNIQGLAVCLPYE